MGRLYQETFNAFINYLKTHGFPESSLAIEMPVGNNFQVDLAIIDPETKIPISLFEFKDSPKNRKFGEMQLASFLGALGNPDIPTFLVFEGNEQKPFVIERVYFSKDKKNDNLREELKLADLPDYKILRESAKNLDVNRKKRDQEKTLDVFKIVCWIMAGILFIGVIFDIVKVITINANQLALIGATVALIIIPFASKLKLLGMEFERIMDKSDKENKD